ncbi:MAG TPA: acyl-CoA synthetase [Pseudolabrys sp.]|nr:acyl-CoA synthetase [Pseudolabrys sp.]
MPTTSATGQPDLGEGRAASAYDDLAARFSWQGVAEELGWSGDDVDLGLTILDRNVDRANAAIVWVDEDGAAHDVSYRTLARESSRCAHMLRRMGVARGDRVAGLMPRIPETIILMVACFKLGAIYVPIFTGFATDGIRFRVENCNAKVLCTHAQFFPRIGPLSNCTIVCVDGHRMQALDFHDELKKEPAEFQNVRVRRDDPVAIIYTSGSTGMPKGGMLAANLLASIWPYLRYAVAIRNDDRFWPTGDPGWGYGLICYLTALAAGGTVVMVRQNLKAPEALALIARVGVTNLATTPTLLREVVALGTDAVKSTECSVHTITSCGEPLNSEVVQFFRKVWNISPLDQFGATEFGVLVSNYSPPLMEVLAGSMGLGAFGHEIAILDDKGQPVTPGEPGFIAKRQEPGSLYFLGYWNDKEGTDAVIVNDWIMTGDLVRQDERGYYWFQGRTGDMIKSSGYRIGPFEVESAILMHPTVAEAAVVGKPDERRGEIVKAFVVLKSGIVPSPGLSDELVEQVKQTLGRPHAPREIEFVGDLPKTTTGKIQRYILRQRG